MKIKLSELKKIVKNIINEGDKGETYYMFFQNLQQIKDQCEELLSIDKTEIDNVLKSGHDWAADHISTSKDDVEEVFNFLKNRKDNKNTNGFITESDLNNINIITLAEDVYMLYGNLDRETRMKIKSEWKEDGLNKMPTFRGIYIDSLINMENSREKSILMHEMTDQLEIISQYVDNKSIKTLINKLLTI